MIIRTLFSLLAAGLVAAQASAQVTSLAAHYKLDETSGSALLDSSGNGLSGTYQGGYTLGQTGARPGTGTAVDFDETQVGYGSIPDGLPLTTMLSDLSVSAWVYPESDGVHLVMRIFGNNDSSWSCARHTTGLTFTTRHKQDYLIDATVPFDQWTHVAFVFDTNYDVTFYVDGVNIGTVTGTSEAWPPNPEWRIGSLNASVEYWNGLLDDIQVYEGTLTDSDVAFLYTYPGSTIGGSVGTPYCFGNTASGNACPCGNDNDGTTPLGGCQHDDSDAGARLEANGLASISSDTLLLLGSRGPISNSTLFFQANNDLSGAGNFLGDGIRCAGGGLIRLKVKTTDAGGNADSSPAVISTRSASFGHTISPGETLYYQWWIRDPAGSPCGNENNTSNGYEITWLP